MSQRARWLRIVEAAGEVATAGGYDAVSMRVVAERADVSTATLYRYFHSKQHLIVAALGLWLEEFECRFAVDAVATDDPIQRLWAAVDALYAALREHPLLAEAMARAYIAADASAAAAVEAVRLNMSEMFAEAVGGGVVTPRDASIGQVLSDMWAANVLAITHDRMTAAELTYRLQATVRLLTDRSSPRS
jgi:AcrR family transcriptional regulator